MYKVLLRTPNEMIPELLRLYEAYKDEHETVAWCCLQWTSDSYVVLRDLENAYRFLPPAKVGSRSSAGTDRRLTLKLILSCRIDGGDLLTLLGPRVTQWAKKHLEKIEEYLTTSVSSYETNTSINLLEKWSRNCHTCPYFVYTGSFRSTGLPNVKLYSFSLCDEALPFVEELTREAENTVREELEIPRVGEGWVSETNLFYEIKTALPDTTVLHHARPVWLGRQHLDILLPELRIAVEFQGVQHDQPVAYFSVPVILPPLSQFISALLFGHATWEQSRLLL
jgi:hypothetical protein